MTVRARNLWIAPLFVGAFGVTGWLGCSASSEEDATSGFDDPSSSGTGNSTASGGAGGDGQGGTGSGQGGKGGGLDLSGGNGSGQGGGRNCIEQNVEAEQVQLDVIVL